MNYAAIGNYLGSAVGFAVTAFLTTFVSSTMDMKTRLHVAGAAAVTALIQHLRENPFKLS